MKIAAVVVFIIEVILSHTPGTVSGNQSRWLSSMTGVKEGLLRRIAHVALFLLLALFSGLGFERYGMTAAFIWSFLDELTKIPIPGRHFSWFDVALNMLGAAAGTALVVFLR